MALERGTALPLHLAGATMNDITAEESRSFQEELAEAMDSLGVTEYTLAEINEREFELLNLGEDLEPPYYGRTWIDPYC